MSRRLLFLVLNLIFILPSLSQWINRRQDPANCITPEKLSGICIPLSFCPRITNFFSNTEEIIAVQYLIAAHQNCGGYNIRGDLVVCCMLQQESEIPQWSELPQETLPTVSTLETTPMTVLTIGPRNPFFPIDSVTTKSPPIKETTTKKPKNPFLPEFTTKTTSTTPFTTLSPQKPHNPFLPHVIEKEKTTKIAFTTTTSTSTTITPEMTTNTFDGTHSNKKPCDGPYLNPGVCVSLKDCPDLRDELKRVPDNENFKNYLRSLNDLCGNNGFEVCCEVQTGERFDLPIVIKSTDMTPTKLPTPEEGCGHSTKVYFNKIVGGEPSTIGAWPWIALLGYQTPSGLRFLCGGTLITARHVLTAAHCIRRDLESIRLGEHDLSREDEANHMDFKILKMEKHPEYNSRNGRADLAILYLEKNVEFSDFISPICLPLTDELRSKSYVKHSPIVIGWGKTMEDGKSSKVLLQLSIPVHENKLCKVTYEKQNRLLSEDQFDNSIICAGALSGGKDTCHGDSGGPLMVAENYNKSAQFYLIGVVSYGIGCARPEIPGVYASTQYFMDWIIEKVATL